MLMQDITKLIQFTLKPKAFKANLMNVHSSLSNALDISSLTAILPLFPCLILHRVDELMSQKDIICYKSARYECTLIEGDNGMLERLQSVGEDFGAQFIQDIAQAYWFEFTSKLRFVFLWN